MKTVKLLILACTLIVAGFPLTAQDTEKSENLEISKSDGVHVYYFHFSRRCATCQTVEKVAKEAVQDLYGDKVIFSAHNLDEAEGEKKGSEVGVSRQTLLIVGGDTKIDITNEGFMNAKSQPEKLKKIIKEKVDPLL